MPGRTIILAFCLSPLASEATAQASVASDLWRVAQGTLVTPASLSDDGAAAFWTPDVVLGPGQRLRVGVEAIQAPTEVGVNGAVLAVTARATSRTMLNLTYGRLGLGDVGYTETSPELVGSSLPVYNQALSLGVARTFSSAFSAGLAVRYLNGKLAFESRSQFGFDVGARYTRTHLRLGASTRFFDPGFGSSRQAAVYNAGAEVVSGAIDAWGARTNLSFRYGITAAPDDGTQHLLSAGLTLGPALTLDAGASYQSTATQTGWRTLLAIGLGAGRYTVRIGRDGGINGFGATYRFGLTAVFK